MNQWERQERLRRLQAAEARVRRDAAVQRELDREKAAHVLARAGDELELAKETAAKGSPMVAKLILASADRKLCQYADLRGEPRPVKVKSGLERGQLFRDAHGRATVEI